MYRGIVFGDFGGIQEGVWVQLWSGTIGAIVSAGVAALVAVMVLAGSNDHQRKLAEKQLAEQRAEAGLVRERAAIAEVMVACEGFLKASERSLAEVRNHLSLFQAAVARWRVELGNGEMQSELLRWNQVFFIAAGNHALARGANREAFDILSKAISSFTFILLAWPEADATGRCRLRTHLTEERDVIEAATKAAEPDKTGLWLSSTSE